MTRILLLEDDTSLIDGLEYALRKNGFEINTVRTVRGQWSVCASLARMTCSFSMSHCQTALDLMSVRRCGQPAARFRSSFSRHRTRR